MTEHQRPVFGANGAVLNSDTMSESLRDEYEIETNRSFKHVATVFALLFVGVVLFVYASEQVLNWLNLPTWVVEYATIYFHVFFLTALLTKRSVVSALGAACLVGLVYVSMEQAQDLSSLRSIVILLTIIALIWRARTYRSQSG